MVRETVPDVSELALLDVYICQRPYSPARMGEDSPCLIGLKVSSLEISSFALVHRGTSTTTKQVRQSIWDAHVNVERTVEHGLGLIGKERDVAVDQIGGRIEEEQNSLLERRDDLAVLLNEHSVLESVGGLHTVSCSPGSTAADGFPLTPTIRVWYSDELIFGLI